MDKYYLAIDIGASSGRHILGHMEEGKMVLEEIYRFPNGMKKQDGEKVWDIDALFEAVVAGMKKCRELGKIPVSVGMDTWAVDFVLLDKNDERIGNAVAYRDDRTKGMDEKVYRTVPEEELYAATGIQKQIFNSIYQLMAWKEKKPEALEQAETLLMIPDYLNFLLSGVKAQEYTNATTTQLVNPATGDWNKEMIRKLGYPEKIFLPISEPGTVIGHLKKEIQEQVGFDCEVVLPATHDTGSAVAAVPSNEDHVLYISSGTWSLMGTELKEADCGKEAMQRNFTNEGGYNRRYRFLKNIMGLWMIQSVKKEIAEDLGFGTICEMASKCSISSIVVAAVIYNSLAVCYAETLHELEDQTGCRYETIHVVGGGANADYLNRLTAEKTGRIVLAGPTEATAIGNLAVQMIAGKELNDLKDARNCIFHSFDIKKYEA